MSNTDDAFQRYLEMSEEMGDDEPWQQDDLHPLVHTARHTVLALPEVWEGVLHDGRHFYLRYRSGNASLVIGDEIGTDTDEAVKQTIRTGDALQGAFDSAQHRREVFAALLRMHGMIS